MEKIQVPDKVKGYIPDAKWLLAALVLVVWGTVDGDNTELNELAPQLVAGALAYIAPSLWKSNSMKSLEKKE